MAKRGPMDIYMKQRQSVSDLDDSDSNKSDAGSTEVLTAERSRLTFVRKYDPSYLKFGFIGADEAGVNIEELNISVDLKDKLLELSADEGLRNSLESNSLASFWIKIKAEYPRLSGIAISTLLPFPSTYLCEAGFSTMSCLKGKHRNALDIHAPLRVALSSIEPQLDKLVANSHFASEFERQLIKVFVTCFYCLFVT